MAMSGSAAGKLIEFELFRFLLYGTKLMMKRGLNYP